jgi:hypothetical protein
MYVQVERVTQEVPFTRAHCRLLPDEEEVAAAEATAEHVLEDAPPGAPLLAAMAAHAAAAAAAANAAAQVCGACARRPSLCSVLCDWPTLQPGRRTVHAMPVDGNIRGLRDSGRI